VEKPDLRLVLAKDVIIDDLGAVAYS